MTTRPFSFRGRTLRRAVGVALVPVLALTVGACGDSKDASSSTTTTAEGRPVTFDEAARLSRVLNGNYVSGGASFTITAPLDEGVELTGQGDVNWSTHFGHAEFERHGTDIDPDDPANRREFYWAPEATLEGGIPDFEEMVAASGLPPAEFIERPASTDEVIVDRLLAFVMKLAAERADNPVVVMQDGATWVGSDEIDGQQVDIISFGKSTYWIGQDDGRLYRYEADVQGLPGPVVVELSDHGPRTIATPTIGQIVDGQSVSEIFQRQEGNWPYPD